MEVTEQGATVQLSVRDDGAGFDPEAETETEGFGLLGMRERIELLSGKLLLDSAPGRGTTVRASIPAQRLDEVSPASAATTGTRAGAGLRG